MTLETIHYHIEDIKRRLFGTPDFGSGFIEEVCGDHVYINHKQYPNTSATINMAENTIQATSGSRAGDSRQDLNEIINCQQGGFLRNAKYIIDRGAFKYYTDSQGRVRRVVARLSDNLIIQHGTRPKYPSGKDKLASDDHSHIIGYSLMGPQERINIVYLNYHTNREILRPLETFLAENMRAKDYRLILNVKLNYPSGASLRPASIQYMAHMKSEGTFGNYDFTFQNPIEP